MIEVGIVGAGIIVERTFGAFEAAEEIIEVRMRTTRDSATALRLKLGEGDLHGIRPCRGG
ncbi:hypothetical protein [Bradyrhizobium sp. USDA 4470]